MTEGPFGRAAANGVPDLAAMAAARELQAQGFAPFPVMFADAVTRVVNELVGIRRAVTPMDVKLHIPTCTRIKDVDTGEPKGYLVFCSQCSDMAGTFVYPCQLLDDTSTWPPQILIADPDTASLDQASIDLDEDESAPADTTP